MNFGDILFTILSIIPIILVISVIIFVIIHVKKFNRRAEEKLQLERENIMVQQKKLEEIERRIADVEAILKQVD